MLSLSASCVRIAAAPAGSDSFTAMCELPQVAVSVMQDLGRLVAFDVTETLVSPTGDAIQAITERVAIIAASPI